MSASAWWLRMRAAMLGLGLQVAQARTHGALRASTGHRHADPQAVARVLGQPGAVLRAAVGVVDVVGDRPAELALDRDARQSSSASFRSRSRVIAPLRTAPIARDSAARHCRSQRFPAGWP